MKAIVFERPGAVEDVLQYQDAVVPACGPRQALIRVTARVIQPADWLFIAGQYAVKPSYPQVAGFDGAGVVEKVGSEVHGLEVGCRVAFRSPGAWGDYATASLDRIYPVPAELAGLLSDDVVCQFALNPLTAWGLLDLAPGGAALRILLTAARSVVAAVAYQLARKRGMVVERLVRSDNGYRLLDSEDQTLGVGDTVAGALDKTAPYNIVLDPVGGPNTLALIERVLPGGTLLSYGVLDDRPIEIKASTLLYKSLRWQGFAISSWLNRASPETLETALRECWALLADHPSKLPVIARYKLEDFRKAMSVARESAGEGKVILA
ncbi:MAG: hypothetical protein E5X74_05450 [Mesorhizobium sp.]|uniref:alcohol dehydrogenase catalytic domain-containing protein n=1 Tax=Mesorhizobium sp. TaxID=1871066 RepID=UPI001219BA4B|nr:zinc-binding dehydrogenase [Mesorhizobium sp.]TIO78002.1 MAG: hypothetical protein E5X75_07250 [Mesorhizobium sp.]TIO86730.1 MAG: hypothetical protein E5X74_05450 [Mesorhizobium sp.]